MKCLETWWGRAMLILGATFFAGVGANRMGWDELAFMASAFAVTAVGTTRARLPTSKEDALLTIGAASGLVAAVKILQARLDLGVELSETDLATVMLLSVWFLAATLEQVTSTAVPTVKPDINRGRRSGEGE